MKRRLGQIAAAAALLGLLGFVSLPAEPLFPVCGYHWLTGRPCPLCGLTRALFSLAKGNWRDAVAFNALSPLALLMLLSLVGKARRRAWLWTGGAAAFGAYGVARFFLPGI